MKPTFQCAIALLFVASACSDDGSTQGSYDDSDDLVNDSFDAQNDNEAAYAGASQELRDAAAAKGDLACGLPELSDSRAGNPANAKDAKYSYNTDATPAQVYAFYRLAAEARGGSAQVTGPPGLADAAITLTGGSKCRVIAQAQLSGDTHVMVMPES